MKDILWIATSNQGKIEEFRNLLNNFEIKTLSDLENEIEIPEDEDTFEGNSMFKAKSLYEIVKAPVIADDSGLMVHSLNNFPGIYSARWAKPLTDWTLIEEKLLNKMKEANLIKKEDRKATFKTVVSYYDGQVEKFFVGEIKGVIENELKGDQVFGYDQIFKPDSKEETFSMMTKEEKNSFSHRKLATEKLIIFLSQKGNKNE